MPENINEKKSPMLTRKQKRKIISCRVLTYRKGCSAMAKVTPLKTPPSPRLRIKCKSTSVRARPTAGLVGPCELRCVRRRTRESRMPHGIAFGACLFQYPRGIVPVRAHYLITPCSVTLVLVGAIKQSLKVSGLCMHANQGCFGVTLP
jgi:hypothetical protein